MSFSFKGEAGGDDDRSLGNLDMNMGVDINYWQLKVWSKNVFDVQNYNGGETESEVEGVDNFYLGRSLRPRAPLALPPSTTSAAE